MLIALGVIYVFGGLATFAVGMMRGATYPFPSVNAWKLLGKSLAWPVVLLIRLVKPPAARCSLDEDDDLDDEDD